MPELPTPLPFRLMGTSPPADHPTVRLGDGGDAPFQPTMRQMADRLELVTGELEYVWRQYKDLQVRTVFLDRELTQARADLAYLTKYVYTPWPRKVWNWFRYGR